MRICLEDKCVLALLQSNPTFRRRFTAIWRMAVTDGIVSAFIPPIRALSQTKKSSDISRLVVSEISELANYYDIIIIMMEGTVGTGQSLLVLESSFLAPNPVYK